MPINQLGYRIRFLVDENHGTDSRNHWPPAGVVKEEAQALSCVGVLGATAGRRAVGQGTVEEDGARAVDIGHINHAPVQGVIAAVTDHLIQVGGVAVLITTAFNRRVATAGDGLAFVLLAGVVVEAIRMGVWVEICTVKPEARPEGHTQAGTDEDRGYA